MRACLAVLIAGLALVVPSATVARYSAAHPLPGAPACTVFPADNPWNQRVDALPAAGNSAAMIAKIGLNDPVHPDFGSGLYNGSPIGIPYMVVSKHTRRVPVSFQYASESDGHLYPLPRGVAIEGGAHSTGDRHVIVVDRDSCRDYELFAAYPHRRQALERRLGSDLQPALRPPAPGRVHVRRRRRPADPAGLALYSEVPTAPSITRCASPRRAPPRNLSTRPATRRPLQRLPASSDGTARPSQARRRSRAFAPRPAWSPALKRYGVILADNGSPWYVSGAPSAAGTTTTCTCSTG